MGDYLKFFAFYLPQFHECEYNNKWWGKGFTEWVNVRSATPLFEGHLQPKIPATGYYDLSNADVISKQSSQAKKYGIDGFVFYHYWYNGERPLCRPIDTILKTPSIDVNFSLCWANHSWTRSWKNRQGALDVLIEQGYENCYAERLKHYKFLSQVFADDRYNRVNGKPLFQIYAPQDIPNLAEYISGLREYCFKEIRTELHIATMITAWSPKWGYLKNFDSVSLHQPTLSLYSPEHIFSGVKTVFDSSFMQAFLRALPEPVKRKMYIIQDNFFNKVTLFDYDLVWQKLLRQTVNAMKKHPNVFPTAFVDFDNTPRYKGRAKMMQGFSPEKFGLYLEKLAAVTVAHNNYYLFLNAWNEWGEGMYLEPDLTYGNRRLEQVLRVKEMFNPIDKKIA